MSYRRSQRNVGRNSARTRAGTGRAAASAPIIAALAAAAEAAAAASQTKKKTRTRAGTGRAASSAPITAALAAAAEDRRKKATNNSLILGTIKTYLYARKGVGKGVRKKIWSECSGNKRGGSSLFDTQWGTIFSKR